MKNISNQYMKILNEIRINKDISVSELCEGIISERTFYRMMSSEEIHMDLYSKLVSKLGIDTYELLHNSIYIPVDDSRLKFIYRACIHYFNDIEQHYENIKVHKDENIDLDYLLQYFVAYYEHLQNRISTNDYEDKLNSLVQSFQERTIMTPYKKLFLASYLNQKPHSDVIPLDVLSSLILEWEKGHAFMFHLLTLDAVLDYYIDTESDQYDTFLQLLTIMDDLLDTFPHKYFYAKSCLYHAFYEFHQKAIDSVNDSLYKYISNWTIMYGGKEYEKAMNRIQNIFDIDTNDFLFQYSENKLQTKYQG